MDQFERVRSIMLELRSLTALARSTGTPDGEAVHLPSDAVARKWAVACVLAADCLGDGGLDPSGTDTRPDYCFPTVWRDCLRALLATWEWPEGDPPLAIPVRVLDHALRLADALETATMSSVGGRTSSLPLMARESVVIATKDVAPPGTREGAAAAAGDQSHERFAHADDFTWIIWNSLHYPLNKGQQAESVRALWESWERGGRRNGCGLSEATISDKVGSSNTAFRLAHVFRDSDLWSTVIRQAGKGKYALFAESPGNHKA